MRPAACHMMMVGRVKEGIHDADPFRQRYDIHRYNPRYEFKCSNNDARGMANFTLLTAFSGFQFDLVEWSVGFEPVITQEGLFR